MTLTRRVLIVLPDAAHLMDVAGPAQVFVNASEVGGRYEVGYVGAAGRVQSHQGLAFAAPTDWPDLTPADLVLVPGWKTQTAAGFAPALLTRIREHWDAGGHVASICAGALALARTGVLAGHSATTHHDLIDELATSRDVSVMRDVLYTCEDRLHTSAGIASGIDLALHLVAHDHGPALAARVARTLVVPAWRAGAAPQASVMLTHRDHLSDLAHRAQDVLDDPAEPPHTLDALARRLGVSGRTLARHFVAATGLTPQAYSTAVRRERARHLQTQGWTRHAAATAVGYADARSPRARRGTVAD
ncbi:GlxA family transcriptional regulator [Mobilicoccus caccae]|uniref:AraC family transcriptional regulator n=1 Tax=Mobilicoccus caccae TaxID=1859295 RepID=A0ABQ6IVF4_9MICO|nr:DJ-1/PfpI family protein [Mobilicoccus caccae]GMA41464.1 AraC family transcriptional regulator [Mobilicoccus caccae]